MLLADGFEKAFIGITIPNPSSEEVAVYDYYKCIEILKNRDGCLLYTSPSPRDGLLSRMPSSA